VRADDRRVTHNLVVGRIGQQRQAIMIADTVADTASEQCRLLILLWAQCTPVVWDAENVAQAAAFVESVAAIRVVRCRQRQQGSAHRVQCSRMVKKRALHNRDIRGVQRLEKKDCACARIHRLSPAKECSFWLSRVTEERGYYAIGVADPLTRRIDCHDKRRTQLTIFLGFFNYPTVEGLNATAVSDVRRISHYDAVLINRAVSLRPHQNAHGGREAGVLKRAASQLLRPRIIDRSS